MKLSEKRARDFVVGIMVALCGYLLAGCDGGATSEDGALIPPGEPSALHCQIPSPTYEKTTMPSNGIAVASVVVSNAPQAAALCEAWTVAVPASVNGAGYPVPASCMIPGSPECSVTMTAEVCRNVSDDFVDSAGGRHCFHLAQKLDHNLDDCSFDSENTSVRDGSMTCQLSSLGLLNPAKTDNRMVEICTADGQFVGWQCPNDSVD